MTKLRGEKMQVYTSCSNCKSLTLHEISPMDSQGKKTQKCSKCGAIVPRKSQYEKAIEEEKRQKRYSDRTFEQLKQSVEAERSKKSQQ